MRVFMRCKLLLQHSRNSFIHNCDCVMQVLNLYANDGERLFKGATWAAHLANGPIILIVGMAYAISLFGVWALVGFFILLLMIPLQVRMQARSNN